MPPPYTSASAAVHLRVRAQKLVRLVHDEHRVRARDALVENLDARHARLGGDVLAVALPLQKFVGRAADRLCKRAREARLARAGSAVEEDVEPAAGRAGGEHLLEKSAVLLREVAEELPRQRLAPRHLVVAFVKRGLIRTREIGVELIVVEPVFVVHAPVTRELALFAQGLEHLGVGAVNGHRVVQRTLHDFLVLGEVVEDRIPAHEHQHEQIRLHLVEVHERAEIRKTCVERGIVLPDIEVGEDAVLHELKETAQHLAERFLVPDACEHLVDPVDLKVKRIASAFSERTQFRLGVVDANHLRHFIATHVPPDEVEEIPFPHQSVIIADHVRPVLKSPAKHRIMRYVLESSHSTTSKADFMPSLKNETSASTDGGLCYPIL